MDIESRVGDHSKNVERARINSEKHLRDRKIAYPGFDVEGSDFCYCQEPSIEALLEFDDFLSLRHADCGKLLFDDTTAIEIYMKPIRVKLEHGIIASGEHYITMEPVSGTESHPLAERDCDA